MGMLLRLSVACLQREPSLLGRASGSKSKEDEGNTEACTCAGRSPCHLNCGCLKPRHGELRLRAEQRMQALPSWNQTWKWRHLKEVSLVRSQLGKGRELQVEFQLHPFAPSLGGGRSVGATLAGAAHSARTASPQFEAAGHVEAERA